LIKEIADAMVTSGMKEAGYEYLVLDCGWSGGRDEQGNLLADPRKFPAGIKLLADYIHSKGLKFGLYTTAASQNCCGGVGSRGYEFQDARTFAAWGVDYLKDDWCAIRNENQEAFYQLMSEALKKAGRPIVFAICEWGLSEPWKWAPAQGHLWRTTGDIQDCWDCRRSCGGMGWTIILDKQVDLGQYAGPGHWNDPDMLEVGNGGMSDHEYRAHFSLWCMLAAPLMAGNDLRQMSPSTVEILTNLEVIAVDQDLLGRQGFLGYKDSRFEVWIKELAGEDYAVCIFNRSDRPVDLNLDWQTFWGHEGILDYHGKKIVFQKEYLIRDLWQKKNVGTAAENFRAPINAHDVILLRLMKNSIPPPGRDKKP
jgi:alpha-galactosidase